VTTPAIGEPYIFAAAATNVTGNTYLTATVTEPVPALSALLLLVGINSNVNLAYEADDTPGNRYLADSLINMASPGLGTFRCERCRALPVGATVGVRFNAATAAIKTLTCVAVPGCLIDPQTPPNPQANTTAAVTMTGTPAYDAATVVGVAVTTGGGVLASVTAPTVQLPGSPPYLTGPGSWAMSRPGGPAGSPLAMTFASSSTSHKSRLWMLYRASPLSRWDGQAWVSLS
jgi:hypothetical protein